MISSSSRTSLAYVPSDFSDLYEHYYAYVVRLIQSRGVLGEEADDIAMTILATFFEKDALSDFDPEREVKFGSFLSGFVLIYLRHHRDMLYKRKNREPVILDRPVGDENNPTTLRDVLFTEKVNVSEVEYADLLYSDLVRAVDQHLGALPRNSRSTVDLQTLFRLVVAQVEQYGKIDLAELSEIFGVTKNGVSYWLPTLRDEVAKVLAA